MAIIGKGKKRSLPAVSTASLPDIIFTLLFFFIVTGKVRDSGLKVKHSLPSAVLTKKLASNIKTSTLHIGTPLDSFKGLYGSETIFQLGGGIMTRDPKKIHTWAYNQRFELKSADRGTHTIDLKGDKTTKYQVLKLVTDELRKAEAYNINYGAGLRNYGK